MNEAFLLAHEAMCFALFYSCFCRAVKTTKAHTRVVIRLAIWLLGIAASMGIVWPIYKHWQPDAFSLVLLFSVTASQIIFAHLWKARVPDAYQKDSP